MSSNSVETIFKESFDKLNSILMYLDHQLGTVSLTKEEIESLGGVKNEVEPGHKILEEKKETQKKETKKKEKTKKETIEKKEEKEEVKKEEQKEVKKEDKKEEKVEKTEKTEKKKNKKGENTEEKKKLGLE